MTNAAYDFKKEAPRVERVLNAAFPGSFVRTKPSYGGRVGIVIVAGQLDDLDEAGKVSAVHEALRTALGPESVVVGNVRVYSGDEL